MIKNVFNGKKKLSFYLIIIGVILVGITLGSALLSSTLKIIGNSEIKKNSWVIYFDDIDIAEDSAPNSNPNDNARISKNGVADPTKQNIEFTAHLDDPGDFYEFTVWTVNDGTIDAEVESLEKSVLTTEQKKYLEFDVTYDDGTPIEQCDILYHKGSTQGPNKRLVKAIVKYKKGLPIEDYPTDGVDLNFYFKINYSQNVNCEKIEIDEPHKLTIRPNGGVFEGRKATVRKYLFENEQYLLNRPTRNLYNFDGWDVIDPETGGTYHLDPSDDKYLFTMGSENVTIEAKWKEGDYVARIMDHYYTKVELAFDAVDGVDPSTGRPWENNTVWLIRDTEEVAVNNARSSFVFNLDGHTLTGQVVNPSTGKIALQNGKIIGSETVEASEKQRRIDEGKTAAPFVDGITGEAVLNYGTLTLGKNDGTVEVDNSIALLGEQYGLFNVSGSKFKFYDGYVQGQEGLSGIISQLSQGDVTVAPNHITFVDSKVENGKTYQKVYLVPSPNRAVAKTTTVIEAYYYNLQDAIDTVIDTKNKNSNLTDNDYVIEAIRTFEAAYDITIQRKDRTGNPIATNTTNARVFFDLKGYSVQTGEPIVNKGYLKVYNSKDKDVILKLSKTFTNEGTLEIDNVDIPVSSDADGIVNKGALKLSDVTMNSRGGYCVKNIESGTLDFNPNVVLRSVNKDEPDRADQYALYNSGNNATVNNGTIFGLYNTGTITLTGENTKYIPVWNYTDNRGNKVYLRAIYNTGNITMNNGEITTNIDTPLITNNGTFTFNDGTLNSEYLVVDNSGTFNVKGNEVVSSRTVINGGTVNIDGGTVRTSSTNAITSSTVNVKSGELIAEDGIAVGDYSSLNVMGGTVTGTTYGIKGERSSINVSSGTITAPIAADVSSATVSGGNVIGSEYAIIASSTNISGGNITSPKNAVVTSNLTMTGGKVDSTNEVGITINSTGSITGGEVYGGTFGVDSKGTLTLGNDDGTISSTSPLLEGELLGLNIQGTTTNFYDGILKGQRDGYEGDITGLPLGGVVGEGSEDRGTDGIYNTDFVSEFDSWLRIGNTPYNTLNAASSAVNDGETTTIVVTRDADIKFSQKIFDDNKNKTITLDLNGHKLTTTQDITNYTNLIIIDSSTGSNPETDKGDGPSSLKILKNTGVINYNRIEINAGRYESLVDQVFYNKTSDIGENDEVLKGIEINNATFNVPKSIITNGIYEDYTNKPGYVRINGINVESSYNTITNERGVILINGTKNNTTGEYTTVINATNYAVANEGSTYIFGGKINANKRVVSGDDGYVNVNEIKNIHLDDDNQVASTEITANDEYALYSYWGTIDVNGGNVKSINNTAIVGHHPINVNGGIVTGTRGIQNEIWCGSIYCGWEPITVRGGTIIGTQYEGIHAKAPSGYSSYIYGGLIIGNTDGIYNESKLYVGVHEEGLSITEPEIRGINGYALNNDGYWYFYDGILKGKRKENISNSSHNGMIQVVEDATMVKRDYEYINSVYYETEYLVTQGDWLEIEGKGIYNTVDKACHDASSGDTIKVIADTHIAFEQYCESGKNLTFDLNGHSVSFTQPITFDSNIIFTDSVGNGLLNNQRTSMIISRGTSEVRGGTYRSEGDSDSIPFINQGTSTITGGHFESTSNYAIKNQGTMIYNDTTNSVIVTSEDDYGICNTGTLTFKNGNVKTYGGLYNEGTFNMENGIIEGTNTYSLDSAGGMSTISGGEIINKQGVSATFHCSGDLTMNGGKITSTINNAISASGGGYYCDSTEVYINNGSIKGRTNGIAVSGTGTSLEVNGGSIIGENNNGINIYNTPSQLNGGVMEGGTYGVYTFQDYSYTSTILGANDNNVSIDTPVLKGELYGLYIDRGTLNFYDGVLKGQQEGYYGQITNIADRTQEYYDDDEVIDEIEYQVVYLLSEKICVRNLDKRNGDLEYTDYSNLQDAFNSASNGDRLVLLDNIPIYYEVTNNKNVTLDMAGYSISTNKKIINNADLEINNTSNNISTIKTSAAYNLITNTSNASLKLDNITLKNNSSSYYVVQSTGDLELKDTTINSIYGVNSTKKLTITSSTINTSYTAINNTGQLSINGGTYTGSYGIYSSTSSNVTVKNASINGIFYNEGNNTARLENSTLNGELQSRLSNITVLQSTLNRDVSNTGTMLIDTCNVNDSISNSNSMTITDSTVTGSNGDTISNSGTMNVINSTTNLYSSYCGWYCTYNGINNSGTMKFNNSTINQEKERGSAYETRAIYNTGNLTIENGSELNLGSSKSGGEPYTGIFSTGNGNTLIKDSDINVKYGSTNYGVYLDSTNSKVVLETGNIYCDYGPTSYGAYINQGTFELGKKLTVDDVDRTVSQTNPKVYSIGTNKGFGVKNINGHFNFYDGVIYGSKYAKPETTSNVEYLYEVTTYVDENTGYEYAWLEFMGDDYQLSKSVASITRGLDTISYPSVRAAIEAANSGETITLLKSTSELYKTVDGVDVKTPLTIPQGLNISIDLNGRSLTAQIVNNGTLTVYDGSVQNFEEPAIINNGTLYTGQNDGRVSSTNIRIISEVEAIKNNGTLTMYDGYLEGNPSIVGEINSIAEFSRIYTVKDTQSEKKYLQSLDENSIRDRETALFIEINPLSGYYDGVKGKQIINQFFGDTVKIKNPIKNGCTFLGWDLLGETTLEPIEEGTDDYRNGYRYKFIVGLTDVTLTARWQVSDAAVAKIDEEYYTSVADAIMAAKENDKIELIKNVSEDVSNNKNITLDLGGYKLTGEFINTGILRVVNGTIENEHGIGIWNKKTLILGENDIELPSMDSVKIIGTTIGIQNDGGLKFYDGYVEGEVALVGDVDAVPQGYSLYIEHNSEKDCQREYLIGNPQNAVAITKNNSGDESTVQYFFSLQDAIDSAAVTGKEIFIIKDFNATYSVTVKTNKSATINLEGHNIQFGNTFTNNGTLRIHDTIEPDEDNPDATKGSMTMVNTLINKGNLTIEDISIKQNRTNNAITGYDNTSTTIKNASIETSGDYCLYTTGEVSLIGDFSLKGVAYGLYNTGSDLVLNSGFISGIQTNKNIEVNNGATIIATSASNRSAIGVLGGSTSSVVVNGGTLTSSNGYVIYTGGSNDVEINGGTLTGKHDLYCDSGTSNYIVNDGTLDATDDAIYLNAANCNLEINGGYIKSTGDDGVYITSTPHILKMTGGTVESTTNSGYVYSYGSSNMSNFVMTGGTIKADDYGLYLQGCTLNMTGGDVSSYGTNTDHAALRIDGYSGATIGGDAYIHSFYNTGIWATNTVTLKDNAYVKAEGQNNLGMYTNGSPINIQDNAKVEALGSSSYAVALGDANSPELNVNGGEIIAKNIAVVTYSGTNTKTVNINNGTISGDVYGIYQLGKNSVVNMGVADQELSTSIPIVTGGLYGIYHSDGTMNFYNGRLRGYTYGYSDTFNNIRSGKQITKVTESIENVNKILTYSTDTTSSSPVSDTPKEGNGAAKITYISEDYDVCTNGQSWPFSYTGAEETFNVPCDGKYKLEVWGAQGGSTNYVRGGYGGYSTGEINLHAGETLYINVGEQPTSKAGGYNGGGTAGNNYSARGGGGATHIALASGLLSTLENNKSSIIIVGGAGGGADNYQNGSNGGSAGGYIGNEGSKYPTTYTSLSYAQGGTQSAGGKGAQGACIGTSGTFGQGGSQCNEHGGGGGAGFYGGGGGAYNSGVVASGAGGSGYIGNTRLTNAYMYGYNIEPSHDNWIVNYLVDREDYIQVGDETFNSIDLAQAAIEENTTGTMILLKDVEINELSTIAANKNVTFDLNGHVLKMTQPIVNSSNLTIIDSSTNKTGKLENLKSNAIKSNNGNVTIDNTIIKAKGSAIHVETTATTVNIINNATVEGENGIACYSPNTIINVNNSTITATGTGIYSEASTTTIDLDNSTINSTTNGIYTRGSSASITIDDTNISGNTRGIKTEGTSTTVKLNTGSITSSNDRAVELYNSSSTFTMDSGTVTAKNTAIFIYGQSNIVTINNGTVTSTNGYAIENSSSYYDTNNLPRIYVKGGTVTGATNGIYIYYTSLIVTGGEVKTTSTNRDNYAILGESWGGVSLSENAFINSPNASGIYMTSGLTISDNAKVHAGANNGYGVFGRWLNITMNDGTIEATGNNSIGLISPSNADNTNYTIKGGTISGTSIGISLEGQNNNTRTVLITGGNISGGKYGIHQVQNYTTTIGDSTKEVSVENPYITGGQYAIYKTSGTLNFYSGKLRGYHKPSETMFDVLRDKKMLYTASEITDSNILENTLNTYLVSSDPVSGYAKAGNGYAKITYLGVNENSGSVEVEQPEIVNNITCSEQVGKVFTFSPIKDKKELDIECAGQYEIQLWGAQGGYRTTSEYGGPGAYVSGKVNFANTDKLYVYVGSSGNNGGFNGGGKRTTDIGVHFGGGATDVRVNTDSLYSRIIVAAGGGSDGASNKIGGAGGTDKGQSEQSGGCGSGGSGATQDAGGSQRGTFGIGGDGGDWSGGHGGAGGGGWYGGGGTDPDYSVDDDKAGGGGSSYVYTSSSYIPSGYNVDPRFYFTDVVKKGGREAIPTHDGASTTIGNSGDGYAKITYISAGENAVSSQAIHTIDLETLVGEIDENRIEYNAGDTLGEIPAPEVDSDSYIFDGWYLDKEYTRKVTENTVVNSSATLYAKFRFNESECSTLIGTEYSFDFTNGEDTFNVYCPGDYKLEVWGAQGGKALNEGIIAGEPGYGGYSSGVVSLIANEILFINVGGQGESGKLDACSIGGYNGGGNGTNDGGGCGVANDNEAAGAGGGATHIAKKSGLLESLENNKDKVLIVAGGGGGVTSNYHSGSGGGNLGGRTIYSTQDVPNQTTGNAFGKGKDGSGVRQPNTCTSGSSASCEGVAGGGGGYYGGYSQDICNKSSATGGSGYIKDSLTDAIMYQYHMDTEDVYYINFLTDKEAFLEVNGQGYNNFEDALEAVGTEGTIKVIKSIEIQEEVVISNDKNVTIDMNNQTLTFTHAITNNGTLTINNGGKIVNNTTNPIVNKGNVTVSNITITSTSSSIIYGTEGSGTIVVNDSRLESLYQCILVESSQRITINSGELIGTQTAVKLNSSNARLTVNGGRLSGGSYGIHSLGESNLISISGGTISGPHAIYDDTGKNSSRKATYNITGGKFIGVSHGILIKDSIVNITNAQISTTANSRDSYALYCNTGTVCTLGTDALIKGDNASAVCNKGELTVNGATLFSGAGNGYGIWQGSGTTTLSDGTITTTGYSSYGVSNSSGTITVNDIDINSKNVGIHSSNDNNSKTINMYGGAVLAENYGIYINQNTTLTYGKSTENVSVTNPFVEGGLYGLYASGGTMSFYSGKLKGSTKAYYGTFTNIRDRYEIFETYEGADSTLIKDKTISTNLHSSTPEAMQGKEGNGYAKVTYSSIGSLAQTTEPEIITDNSGATNCNSLVGTVYTFDAIGEVQYFAPECGGQYKIEVWGAQGGYRSSSSMGGKGGYSSGTVTLENTDELQVYVGTEGNKGGFNGGGTRAVYTNYGGGASDVRLNNSLYSRIIVAGGGGSDGAPGKPGGHGGGATGGAATNGCGNGGGAGGQETSGGLRGTFGAGGSGNSWSSGHGGGGGGGWYGGGGTDPDGSVDDDKGGGGGSGFIYTDTSILPAGYIPTAKYKFINTTMLSGIESMPTHDGTGEMVGNTGDGYVKITFIKSIKSSTYRVKLRSAIGTIENDELRYRSGTELGEIPAPVLSDSTLEFDGWYLDENYTKKIASTYKVKSNLILYAKFKVTNEYCSGLLNISSDFDYTGSEQVFSAACPGTYKLQVWGAQGGDTKYNSNSNTGGYGGYSEADIVLQQNEQLYINIGGKGSSIDYKQSEGSAVYDDSTGYNGGGYATYYTNNSAHAGGGGATHIASRSGLLSALKTHKDDLIIVAGGGGGASTHDSYPNYSGEGGSGGGYYGGDGITSSITCYNYGTGGTQSAGGSYVSCSDDGRTTRDNQPATPTFGKGSNYTSHYSDKTYSGGGGGYYGGQSGWHAPGGGGSGYTGSSRLTNSVMYGYKVTGRYSTDSNVAYLVEAREFIKNINKPSGENTYTTYTNLQDAIDEASNGDTLQLMTDKTISYNVIFDDKELTFDLDGHNFTTIKQITVNNKLNVRNSNANKNITFSSTMSNLLFNVTQHGTLDIDGVDINGKDIISSAGALVLKNTNLNGANTITNTGSTTLQNVNVVSSATALNISGSLSVSNINLSGNTYALYNNSTENITLDSCVLTSNSTAVYLNAGGTLDLIDCTITGHVTNNNSSGTLNIKKSSNGSTTVNGKITNKGNSTIIGMTLNYSTDYSYADYLINNSGILNISGSKINFTGTTSSYTYDKTGIYNTGTATSSNNEFTFVQTRSRSDLVGIENRAIATSTNDKFDLSGSAYSYGVYSDSSHTTTVINADIKQYNINEHAYGLYTKTGEIITNGTVIEEYNCNDANGLETGDGSNPSFVVTNVDINLHDNTQSYGIYMKKGSMIFNSGTIVANATSKAYGASVTNGNLDIKTGTFTISNASNAYGVYISSSTVNIESATIDVTGADTHGVHMDSGTYTQGIYDGRGTESSDVSFTDPHISAVGTSSGIGMSIGSGTFKFYDGYIYGSTRALPASDIISETEYRFHEKYTDNNTTCILEFDM